MKKIDKLVLGSFLGPFFLTFFVVIFILLSQFMLKYLDEIVGKDLDTIVIAELIFYFSIFMTPNAFPLAVLLSSLMTFGNLGQHFELTALKSAGISLIRVLVPIFVFTLFLTGLAYYSNNFIVPKANLKAFSLLYDVKQMKPSMELKEGAFYNGIDGYSIKVGKKYPDGKTLKDIIIYDHTDLKGNKNVTLADSGQMYNILNDQYLVLEMYNGKNYSELTTNRKNYISQQNPDPFVRNEFKSQKVVFSLASFDLKRTKEELFASNRLMKNSFDLKHDADSMKAEFLDMTEEVKENSFQFFDYHLQDIIGEYKQKALDRAERKRQEEVKKERMESGEEIPTDYEFEDTLGLSSTTINIENQVDTSNILVAKRLSKDPPKMVNNAKIDSILASKRSAPKLSQDIKSERGKRFQTTKKVSDVLPEDKKEEAIDSLVQQPSFDENIAILDSVLASEKSLKAAINRSLTHVRYVKNNMTMRNGQLDKLKSELNKFQLERFKKLSYAVTILIMFFIGAPLGSIIKRGGLGIPVLISISFFILFYIVSMISEKYTRTDFMDPFVAAWMANMILLPIGLFFMKQAKNDARLFDTDFYSVFFMKMKSYLFALKSKFGKTKSLN
jgi:lipopolysaccharide export system permease protein